MTSRPEWLKKRAPQKEALESMERLLKNLSLHTVCEGADCPNIGECFANRTATFMIMGEICTRACRFCAVKKGIPTPLDPEEPMNVTRASRELGLKHVVVTSVTRDDLEDGGAVHFATTVSAIRELNPGTTIELLIPDLKGNWDALKIIVDAVPDIINHNVETVPSLYSEVRPQAVYNRSVELLGKVKEFNREVYTKSGMMLGLGEREEEVLGVMDNLLEVGCEILTLGQYLRPSPGHIPIYEYITPEKFDKYRKTALEKGFKYVAAGPFVRSSYKAAEGMNEIKKS